MIFSRKASLMGAIALGVVSLHSVAAESKAETPPALVTIDSGQLEGKTLETGVRAYLGIPYAAPPVRDLRWRDPQPVTAWTGVKHADRFSPQCMQPQRGILTNQYSGAEVTSEDCLYLNVWAKPGLQKAPVIVFIHGGGFFVGSGSMPLYGGEYVAQKDAVFVNFNYRLGAEGFLAHPELSRESEHGTSGNYGFLDQIAALRWIHDNIAQFGGDPSNVTIVGQSAGSMSVLALQASPLAKGLFQRAVGMSGAMIGSVGPAAMRPLKEAEQDGVKLQNIWKAKSIAELRALPADRLVVPRTPDTPPVSPIQDGYVLPESIEQIFAHSQQNDVPLIVGFTHDESFGGLGPVTGLADFRRRATELFGNQAESFLKLYPARTDQEAKEQARAADRDGTMAIGMYSWAMAQAQYGKAPIYSYMFARPHSYPQGVKIAGFDPKTAGAYHTSGVPFWLGTLDSFNRFRQMRAWSEDDRDFSAAMMNSLIAFARTGSPTTDKLVWPTFEKKSPKLIKLGTTIERSNWPAKRKFDFFKSVLSKPHRSAASD